MGDLLLTTLVLYSFRTILLSFFFVHPYNVPIIMREHRIIDNTTANISIVSCHHSRIVSRLLLVNGVLSPGEGLACYLLAISRCPLVLLLFCSVVFSRAVPLLARFILKVYGSCYFESSLLFMTMCNFLFLVNALIADIGAFPRL